MSVVPKELLNKEFLYQFKTEEDLSNFLKELHSQVLEQMLEGEMDYHLGLIQSYAKRIAYDGLRNRTYRLFEDVCFSLVKSYDSFLSDNRT